MGRPEETTFSIENIYENAGGLLDTAKLNGLDPQTYLCDVLKRIVSGRVEAMRI